jgi:Uma2 family endonuclease
MAIQEKLSTAADLWALSHRVSGRRRVELVKGVIREMSPAGGGHGEIAFKIGMKIGQFVEKHRLGRMTAAETGFILSTNPDTVRAPDVGFISKARAPEPLPSGFVPLAPDLAVEVVSPNDTASDIHARVIDFLQAGTVLVWVVYPDSKTVVVHTTDGAQTLTAQDTLDGAEVLPGFKVKVADLFPA